MKTTFEKETDISQSIKCLTVRASLTQSHVLDGFPKLNTDEIAQLDIFSYLEVINMRAEKGLRQSSHRTRTTLPTDLWNFLTSQITTSIEPTVV